MHGAGRDQQSRLRKGFRAGGGLGGVRPLEAAILTVYGLNLTAVGLLVQAGLIGTPANADHHALAWHAYLWDPWLLVWGVLVTAALLRSR